MSTEQTAIDQADFDEMSMIAEQHAKKEDDVTCSDVRELREARARIVELELERDALIDYIKDTEHVLMVVASTDTKTAASIIVDKWIENAPKLINK